MWYMKFATWLNVSSGSSRRASSAHNAETRACTAAKTFLPGLCLSVCIAQSMLLSSITEYPSPFSTHARRISRNKPSPGLYPALAKPQSVFAKPCVVNSGNFAYVMRAKRSSARVDKGTSSGVFPAAHKMLATLCVLNTCGASSHARTTASLSASPTASDTRHRIVEMAHMTFESSMLLNSKAAPGAAMYSENARAVAVDMPPEV